MICALEIRVSVCINPNREYAFFQDFILTEPRNNGLGPWWSLKSFLLQNKSAAAWHYGLFRGIADTSERP